MSVKILGQVALVAGGAAQVLLAVPTGQEVVTSTLVLQGTNSVSPTNMEVHVHARIGGAALGPGNMILNAPTGVIEYNGRLSVTEGWTLAPLDVLSVVMTGDSGATCTVTLFGTIDPLGA